MLWKGDRYETWTLFKQDENKGRRIVHSRDRGRIGENGRKQSGCWCVGCLLLFSPEDRRTLAHSYPGCEPEGARLFREHDSSRRSVFCLWSSV